MLDPVNPRAPQFGPGGPAGRQAPVVEPGRLTQRQVNEQVDAFLVANKARVRINDGGRDHGQIRAFNNPSFDGATAPPTMILRNEDFGRIARLLADGRPVELDVDIVNRWYPEGRTSYNAVAEIAGSDKAERSDHARRPPGLVARRDRRHRQRHRRGRDDGSGTHHQDAGPEAAPDDPRCAVGRRGAGTARVEGVRREAFRHGRGADPRVRDVWRLPERRLRHRPHPRRDRVRSSGGRPHPARDLRAIRRPRHRRRDRHEEPQHGWHRQHLVQRRRACPASA